MTKRRSAPKGRKARTLRVDESFDAGGLFVTHVQGCDCYHARVLSRYNKHDAHVTMSGATSEVRKRNEPVAQFGHGSDGFRLDHGHHGVDMRGFEPERLFAVDLPVR